MTLRITSHSNPTIKRIRGLRDKKHRRAEGRFLAEGVRVVSEAVEAGAIPETLVYAEGGVGSAPAQRLLAACAAAGSQLIETSRDILLKLTERDNPQAVLGVFPIPAAPLATLDRFAAPMWVVAQALKDPGNLGTMLRTCDAVGAGGVILLDASCDPYSVEAVRASMGALFTRAVVQSDGPTFFDWLRSGPGFLAGASLNAATGYRQVRYRAPVFLFMGNEQSGLPADYEAQCDVLVKLPMLGKADSLNVAVAAAVLLYEVLEQTRPPGD